MTRILVCGGRDYGHVKRTTGLPENEPPEVQTRIEQYQFIHATLHRIVERFSANYNPNDIWLPTDITIIHGAARGADRAASDFATVHFCHEEAYQADWKTHGKSAGFIRNQQMLDEGKPDLVVAFPGGKGTGMMKELARRAGIKVLDMGAKGSQTMVSEPPKFKTKHFEKMYCDRVQGMQGFSSPIQRLEVLHGMIEEEQKWLDGMGADYDEIMLAEEVMNELAGPITQKEKD